jgi:hypothetical protein
MGIEIWELAILVFIGALVILALFNKFWGVWACEYLNWHLEPICIGFDGCSLNGTCPRCGKPVLQDSRGNWF